MRHDVIETTDAWMCRSRFRLPGAFHFYPSEASAKYTDQHGVERVIGQCLRQSYYRISGQVTPTPHDAYTQWIFATGKGVEEILVAQWKEMGIWVANNVKFYDQERNISGEIDIVLRDPINDENYGVEVKSFAGYQATKTIIGNKHQKGVPKDSQLLQTLIYTDQCRAQLPYFKMVYYARDSGERTQYDITLTPDGDVERPTVDGVMDYRFTMNDIYSRYAELDHCLSAGQMPPPDFELAWSPEKVELRKSLGEVSKSAYEKWQKNHKKNPIGNWECRYCSFTDHCWGG